MGKWIGGLAATLIGGVLVFFLVGEGGIFNPTNPPPRGGSIDDITLATASPCCELSVGFKINGFRGQPLSVWHQLVNADTGGRDEWVQDFTATPDADQDSARQIYPISITNPGRYYVVMVINDPRNVEIARRQSDVITFG